MEIDLGNGVKVKNIEGLKQRNQLIFWIILGIIFLLFILKSTFMPEMRWVVVLAPIIASAVVGLIFLTLAYLIMRFAKDF